MLKQLRENTKTILWIVVIAFIVSIFAVWGANQRSGGGSGPDEESNIVGRVNGIELTRQMYSNTWQELYNQIRMQRGGDVRLSDTESYALSQQAWEMMIQKTLIDREIEKQGIIVTDAELVSFLRRNPHPTLRQHFTDAEGNFDYQAYLQALSDPSVNWLELEAWGRDILPELKLETMLSSQVHISDQMIRDRFDRMNTRIKARYVKIPFAYEDPPYEPTEAEINALYEEKKDDFLVPEQRAIRMIKVEKAPTELDEFDVRERMMELKSEIDGGMDFAEAAVQESEDAQTAQNGGDLGFFARGVMDSLFTETAFALSPGEVGGPVRTQFGYHLIRTDEKKTEEGVEKVKARHILMRVEPGYETIDSLRTLFTDLREAILEKGLDAAADFGLEVIEPAPFGEGAFISGEGYLPRLVNFAFNNDVGSISNTMETENYVYIIEVKEIIRETTMPVGDAEPRLIEMIRAERRESAARERAVELRAAAVTGGDLEAAAHAMELEVGETTHFTVDSSIPEIGTGTGFGIAAYELRTDRISPPVKGRNEYYIIQVIDRVPGEPSQLADQRVEITQTLRQEQASRFLALWYDKLRKNAKVEDLRERTLN